ncbi:MULTISPECIES: rhodanese-like domain-containing protein [Aromatoleum]|uniref:Sulfurtransferase n=1 Tax=Aromatoleum anaerobium TaxID=182180 RepID=A0ABX1PKY1_9RHOO|nr:MULTISPECIES: rhodanese-like domain-containing protein [Aromatoleum]MCK0509376.1 sulfurtransferase [Aromatoleum anaerobium]NMG53986.1 sulfurtransferase [Aromatoleum aromaticum]
MRQMTASELADRLADASREKPVLLDVREPWEFETCHIEGSQPMPMATVPAHLGELDAGAETVVICHHGARSAQVGMFLERQGFRDVINLAGGVAAWAAQVEPGMARY